MKKGNILFFAILFFIQVFDASGQTMRNGRDFSGRYNGFLDGRRAQLNISETRADRFSAFNIVLRDLDRGVEYTGLYYYPDIGSTREHVLTNVHLATTDGGNRTIPKVILHTWNTNYISIVNTGNYGSLFSKSGELNTHVTAAKFTGAADWVGVYRGKWDGRNAALNIEQTSSGYKITVSDLDRSARFNTEVTMLPFGSNSWFGLPLQYHYIKNLRVGEGNNSKLIKQMFMHTWNKNYITGISDWAGKDYGFFFVRQ